ncbi:unnamed protein product [Tilletia caries]|nr:unnamed protein product [Tilletia caries]
MVKLRFLFPMTLLLVAIASVGSAPVSKSIDDPSAALSPRYNVPLHARLSPPTPQEIAAAHAEFMTHYGNLGTWLVCLRDTSHPLHHLAQAEYQAAHEASMTAFQTYNWMRVAAGHGPVDIPRYLQLSLRAGSLLLISQETWPSTSCGAAEKQPDHPTIVFNDRSTGVSQHDLHWPVNSNFVSLTEQDDGGCGAQLARRPHPRQPVNLSSLGGIAFNTGIVFESGDSFIGSHIQEYANGINPDWIECLKDWEQKAIIIVVVDDRTTRSHYQYHHDRGGVHVRRRHCSVQGQQEPGTGVVANVR